MELFNGIRECLIVAAAVLAVAGPAAASNVVIPDVSHKIQIEVDESGQYALDMVYKIAGGPEAQLQAVAALGSYHRTAFGKYVEATGVPAWHNVTVREMSESTPFHRVTFTRIPSHSIEGGRYVRLADLKLAPGHYEATVSSAVIGKSLRDLNLKTHITFGRSHHGK